MPRDKRLYMTFPNDFWMHPKIEQLSDSAFRAFVEMNGFSRMQDLDGEIPEGSARRRWKGKSLAELVNSHPTRPVVLHVGDAFVIRDYAEHQETRESIEARRERNAANGARGGRPPKNPNETQSVTSGLAKQKRTVTQTKAESESESKSEIESDFSAVNESSQVSNARAADLDSIALGIGITNLTKTRTQLEKATGEPVTDRGAIALAEAIASRAAGHIRNIDAYIATACRKSPHEVQAAYFDLDIGGIP